METPRPPRSPRPPRPTRLILIQDDKEVYKELVENLPTQIAGHYIDFQTSISTPKGFVFKNHREKIMTVCTKPIPAGQHGHTTVMCWVTKTFDEEAVDTSS